MMQDINEAYLILNDEEARFLYDKEYTLFKKYIKKAKQPDYKERSTNSSNYYKGYDFNSEELKNWVDNARRQSVDLAKETIKEIRTLFNEGLKESGKEMGLWIMAYILIGLISFVLFSIIL